MTNPTQIPAALIPELVEWLIGEDTGADVAIEFWTVEEFITAEYDKRPMKEMNDLCINNPYMDDLRSALTAALEAFNERGEEMRPNHEMHTIGPPVTPVSIAVERGGGQG